MWWLLSVHDNTFLLLALKQLTSNIHYETAFQQFIFLGIIPGTNTQLSFDALCIGLLLFTLALCCIQLMKLGKRILVHMETASLLDQKRQYIDLIAL